MYKSKVNNNLVFVRFLIIFFGVEHNGAFEFNFNYGARSVLLTISRKKRGNNEKAVTTAICIVKGKFMNT